MTLFIILCLINQGYIELSTTSAKSNPKKKTENTTEQKHVVCSVLSLQQSEHKLYWKILIELSH